MEISEDGWHFQQALRWFFKLDTSRYPRLSGGYLEVGVRWRDEWNGFYTGMTYAYMMCTMID